MASLSDKDTRRSKLAINDQNRLIEAYSVNVSARRMARAYGMNRDTVSLFYRKIRSRLVKRLLFETTCFLQKTNHVNNSDVQILLRELVCDFSIIPSKAAYKTFFDYHLLPKGHRALRFEKRELRISIPQAEKDFNLTPDEIELSTGPPSSEQFSVSEAANFRDNFLSRISTYRGVNSSQFLFLIAESLLFESISHPRDRALFIRLMMQESNEHKIIDDL